MTNHTSQTIYIILIIEEEKWKTEHKDKTNRSIETTQKHLTKKKEKKQKDII